ncbi:DUF1810 family protein [Sphingobium yanoikuyae]
MRFKFPQLRGLGHSVMAEHYDIALCDEAEAYLNYRLLGSRYRACLAAVEQLFKSLALTQQNGGHNG